MTQVSNALDPSMPVRSISTLMSPGVVVSSLPGRAAVPAAAAIGTLASG
jgi:hypothetical protein